MESNKYQQLYIYIGRPLDLQNTPDFVRCWPPAGSGDLNLQRVPDSTVVVFIDGLFFHRPAVTHFDLLTLLANGRMVVGAGCMGAIRAVELRHYGMIGVGSVYQYYLDGRLKDDGEIAEALCPYTFDAVTFSLVRIRRALALATAEGVAEEILYKALLSASRIHFMDRIFPAVAKAWSSVSPRPQVRLLLDILQSPESDVKAADARGAIEAGITAVRTGQPLQCAVDCAQLYVPNGGPQ